jgi:alkylation response protein AidB-like acyl-CoA dehydrogenase
LAFVDILKKGKIMSYREIDINITDEQNASRDMARKFGAEVMRPAGLELDKLHDPADVIAKGSVLWDVFKKYRELGFHRMDIPKALGGIREDVDPMSRFLIGEEMGYADAGLTISLGVSNMPFSLSTYFPNPLLQDTVRAYCKDIKGNMIGCWAITEPDHGSDWVLAAHPDLADPKCAPSVRAFLKGDEYIVNGEKSAWVSNGTLATHAVLHVCLDPSKGMGGGGLAIIPLDLPGISRGKPLDKMGQRPLNQGSIIFEDARIPKEFVVIPDPSVMAGAGIGEQILAGANGGMAVVFGGLAKAAFDEALNYSKERIQGGKPIFEHQNIKLKLFNMFTMVEAARGAARRMAFYNAVSQPPSGAHAVACKVLSTETAFKVASEAIQIFGGYGLSREYPIEKMFRDARAGMIEDGVNESLSLAAAEFL